MEFLTEEDADYSIKIMNMIKLYGKPIRVNKASAHQKNLDVGANIFIGNLDPEVDEKLLYDTFSAFGVILTTPKVGPININTSYFQFFYFYPWILLIIDVYHNHSYRFKETRKPVTPKVSRSSITQVLKHLMSLLIQ